MAGKTKKYYNSGTAAANKSLEKKREYQREYNKTDKAKKHRAECNAGRRELGLKKGDKRDASHTKSGKMVAENRVSNRRRNGSDGKSTKKQ